MVQGDADVPSTDGVKTPEWNYYYQDPGTYSHHRMHTVCPLIIARNLSMGESFTSKHLKIMFCSGKI